MGLPHEEPMRSPPRRMMAKPTKRDTIVCQHLRSEERHEIAVYCRQGLGPTAIARKLGWSASTISRELTRNAPASQRPWKVTEAMRTEIHRRLSWDHTPEMIAGCCAVEGIVMVSSEWIYPLIYRDKEQGGDWWKHLPQRHKQRRKQLHGRSRRGMIPHRVSIHERPAIVEERSRIGDFEADTIIRKGRRSGVVTVVD